MRLPDFFDKQADANPAAIAAIFGGETRTYGEIQTESRSVAAGLMAAGLLPGAKVASWLVNTPRFFSIQLGVHRTPYVWMPLNPRASAAECASNIGAFGAQWLFVDARFAEHVCLLRQAGQLRGIVAVNGYIPDTISLDDFCRTVGVFPGNADVRPDDFVTLVTTGGTTGKPKGIKRVSMNWAALIINYRLALPNVTPPINLVATPLTHVAGDIALSVFAQGGTNIILESADPSLIAGGIERHSASQLFVPPTLLYMLLALPDLDRRDFRTLRYLMYGAAPISVEKLREAWAAFGPVMTQLYGLMEATSTVSIMTPAEHNAALNSPRFGSVGRGSPLVMLDVAGEAGLPVPAGEPGEVICRGQNLCDGYENNEEATRAAFKSGWFYTGDIGVRDAEGYVRLVDRSKDIIISGGFNIFPGEIEQVIWGHPAVQDCAVIGAPDDKWGEAVTAVIELKPGHALIEDEILELCRVRLGSLKTPKKIVVWPNLPRSNVGKVLKREIRAQFWKDSGRTI